MLSANACSILSSGPAQSGYGTLSDGMFAGNNSGTCFRMAASACQYPWLKDDCNEAAETCWRRFLKKHEESSSKTNGAAWKANRDRVYRDEQAQCFRLSAKAGTRQ